MTVTLTTELNNTTAIATYMPGLRQLIEDHIPYLRAHRDTDILDIAPNTAHKGHGDLISVLQDYGIPEEQHWIIMRVNNYTSPMQYLSTHHSLLIPSRAVIDTLVRSYKVTQSLLDKK